MAPDSPLHPLREPPAPASSGAAARAIVAGRFSAATLAESGAAILPRRIVALHPGQRLAGRACTVRTAPGQNLWLHRAIYAAEPGDVLVVATGEVHDFGYWGEVMARAALARGLAGLLIDGCVRDAGALGELGFPVFARGRCVRGTGKRPEGGDLRVPVAIGGVVVDDGDLVVGDADGAVVVAAGDAVEVARRAAARDTAEQDVFAALDAGRTTLDIYGFPPTDGSADA